MELVAWNCFHQRKIFIFYLYIRLTGCFIISTIIDSLQLVILFSDCIQLNRSALKLLSTISITKLSLEKLLYCCNTIKKLLEVYNITYPQFKNRCNIFLVNFLPNKHDNLSFLFYNIKITHLLSKGMKVYKRDCDF